MTSNDGVETSFACDLAAATVDNGKSPASRLGEGGEDFEMAEMLLSAGFESCIKICDFYSVSIICPFSHFELISYPLKQFLPLGIKSYMYELRISTASLFLSGVAWA